MADVKAVATNGKTQTVSLSKNAKRRQKKKEQKTINDDQLSSIQPVHAEKEPSQPKATIVPPSTIDFNISTAEEEAALATFSEVFKRFRQDSSSSKDVHDPSDEKGQVIYSDDEQLSESDEEEALEREKLSKRKQRKLQRLTVAELKQIVKRPELVDWEDVTATDPAFLVQIKSTRNTIPVPPHWNLKREYLQNKKGIEKPPFQLPSYIAATGIAEIKDALKEKEAEQTLKAKTRERVQPKMGKVMIDYQKLHDAFFRFQTKPESLTRFGEVYYEGKEFETKFKERKPGELSETLKEALSIPPLAPPPWLIAMQRFGPPPSYPQLRIPGLNAPIPEGAQWGFHPGGWGRPPMDEYGNPLFSEVLGHAEDAIMRQAAIFGEEPQKEHFGDLDPEEEEEDEEDEEEDSEEEEDDEVEEEDEHPAYDRRGLETPAEGLQTPSGLQSVASTVPGGGLETPGFLELRKGARRGQQVDEADSGPKQLYHVLPEKDVSASKGFLTTDHGYDLASVRQGQLGNRVVSGPILGEEEARGTKRKANAGSIDISIDASELEGLSEAQLEEKYNQARKVGSYSGGGGDQNGAEMALLREELQRKRSVQESKRAAR